MIAIAGYVMNALRSDADDMANCFDGVGDSESDDGLKELLRGLLREVNGVAGEVDGDKVGGSV